MIRTDKLRRAAAAAAALLILASCEQKELCFNPAEHVRRYVADVQADYERVWQYTVEGGRDWRDGWPSGEFGMAYDDLDPAAPEGLRVVSYNPAGTHDIVNLPPEGGELYLAAGEHSLLFYNNGTEYIVFDNLGSYAQARATTRARTRSSYLGSPFAGGSRQENTVNPPDILYGHYIESYTPVESLAPVPMPITLRPLVFTYLVRYGFSHGLGNVALARGALSGMAEAVYLNSGATSEEDATILYDCTVGPDGVQAVVRSFGVPGYPNEFYARTRAGRTFGLNLEVMLKNGKTLTFDFDVTDQMATQPLGGVITVGGIKIPDDVAAPIVGGGFDVAVEGWGESKDVPMEFSDEDGDDR